MDTSERNGNMDTEHRPTQRKEGPDGRRCVVGIDCTCGWYDPHPGFKAHDAHLKSLGICARCRNRGRYVVENGNNRYARTCSCKHGRALRAAAAR